MTEWFGKWMVKRVICLFKGHKWKYDYFFKRTQPERNLSPTRKEWLRHLEEKLRKDDIPKGVYPCFIHKCERCGKDVRGIDTLYIPIPKEDNLNINFPGYFDDKGNPIFKDNLEESE